MIATSSWLFGWQVMVAATFLYISLSILNDTEPHDGHDSDLLPTQVNNKALRMAQMLVVLVVGCEVVSIQWRCVTGDG